MAELRDAPPRATDLNLAPGLAAAITSNRIGAPYIAAAPGSGSTLTFDFAAKDRRIAELEARVEELTGQVFVLETALGTAEEHLEANAALEAQLRRIVATLVDTQARIVALLMQQESR